MKPYNYVVYLLSVIFLGISGVYAQNNGRAVVSGKVSTSNGLPAAAVSVAVVGTRQGTTTDEQGRYRLELTEAGPVTLEVSAVGMARQRKTVTVSAGTPVEQDFTIDMTSAQLQEVLITQSRGYATLAPSPTLRLDEPLVEIPQNIQVVSPKALADQQVISMSDGLIRNVSGAVRLEHWGNLYTNISMRGTQIQALRNGFNVVTSYWGPLTEDMSFVDHIEFVKGPAGFLLSNGDPSGSYNVVTKKPTGETKGEALVTVGQYNLYRAAVDLDGKLSQNGKVLYRLNVSAQAKGSHRANESDNRYVVAPVIAYRPDDKTTITAEYTLQYARMSDVGSYYVFGPVNKGYAWLPQNFTMTPEGLDPTNITDQTALLNVTRELTSNWKITAQGYYLRYNQKGSSMWPQSEMTDDGKIIRGVGVWDAFSRSILGQAFVNGNFTTGTVRHRVLTGVDIGDKDYMADWGQSFALDTEDDPFDVYNPDLGRPANGYPVFDRETSLSERAEAAGGIQTQRYAGVYLQDELGFFENQLRLTLAGRYTWVKQSEWGEEAYQASHFTPRIGLSWSIDAHTSAYALYDQAFVPQAGRIYGGGKVKPITGNNQEIGIKRNWAGGNWNTSVSVYRILKENELTADPIHSDPNQSYSIVLGQKVARGVEFDVRGRILPGFDVTANYAYTNAEITKLNEGVEGFEVGDVVPGYSTNTANAWLDYTLQRGPLRNAGISAGFTYLWDRKTYDGELEGVPFDDYFKLDAGIHYGIKNFTVRLNAFNLLNNYLYSGSYYEWNNAFYWQTETPRNLRLSVGYKF
ncbi:MAG: TonB-dependent receptor [Parapedobacter sp.]|nr:MAG: TonB-dependent receptor [Parapedobacter sp.]